jgi:HlyD family secretion protein
MMWKTSLVCAGLIGLSAGTLAIGEMQEAAEHQLLPRYRLAEVTRGRAVTTVLAAGTVQPVVSVVVSSQLSGQVREILVDYNDVVKEGQPIARLDPQLFAFRVEQAKAEVDVATVGLRIATDEVAIAETVAKRAIAESSKAEADAQRREIVLLNAGRRLDRKSQLNKSGSSPVSDSDLDDARAAYQSAVADASSAKAQLAAQKAHLQEAQAQVTMAHSRVAHANAQIRRNAASLRQAETDLERTVIRAPMNGIVIERSVAAGQTVATSLQAPPLFTIGDLRAVSVEIIVDEADIAGIRPGQPAKFTVDAYPGKVFAGTVSQVRKAPHTQESVVTYTVVAAASNDEMLLLPGMTAKAEIITGERPDAPQVPTAALRYRPQGVIQPAGSHVWVFDGHGIHPVAVRVGTSSNAGMTEITDDLLEGRRVVVGDLAESKSVVGFEASRLSFAGWASQLRSGFAELAKR